MLSINKQQWNFIFFSFSGVHSEFHRRRFGSVVDWATQKRRNRWIVSVFFLKSIASSVCDFVSSFIEFSEIWNEQKTSRQFSADVHRWRGLSYIEYVECTRRAKPKTKQNEILLLFIIIWISPCSRGESQQLGKHHHCSYMRHKDIFNASSTERWTVGRCALKPETPMPRKNESGGFQRATIKWHAFCVRFEFWTWF